MIGAEHTARLDSILTAYLEDATALGELGADGGFRQRVGARPGAQEQFARGYVGAG